RRSTSWSAVWGATRSRTMPPARAGPSPRPSAGSPRTSATTPMTEPIQPVQQTRRPAALLWDMDGTLVDTEPYWMATETELAQRYGGTWTHEDAMSLVGNELLVSGAYIKAKLGLEQSAEEVVEMLLDGVVEQVRHAVPW